MKLINMLLSAVVGAVIAGIVFDKYTDGIVTDVIKDAIDPSDEEDDNEEEELEESSDKEDDEWFDDSNMITVNEYCEGIHIGSKAFIGLLNCLGHNPAIKNFAVLNIDLEIVEGDGMHYYLDIDTARLIYSLIEEELEKRGGDSYAVFGEDGIYFERLYDVLDDHNAFEGNVDDEDDENEEDDMDTDNDGEEDDDEDEDPKDPDFYVTYNPSDELIHMDRETAHEFMSVLGINRLSDSDRDHYVMTIDDAFKLIRIMSAAFKADDLNFAGFKHVDEILDDEYITFADDSQFIPEDHTDTIVVGDRIIQAILQGIGFRDVNVTNVIHLEDAIKLVDLLCPNGDHFEDSNRFGKDLKESDQRLIKIFVQEVRLTKEDNPEKEENSDKTTDDPSDKLTIPKKEDSPFIDSQS